MKRASLIHASDQGMTVMMGANYFILMVTVLASCGGRSTESDAELDERTTANGASASDEDETGPQGRGETAAGGYASSEMDDNSELSEGCAGGLPGKKQLHRWKVQVRRWPDTLRGLLQHAQHRVGMRLLWSKLFH